MRSCILRDSTTLISRGISPKYDDSGYLVINQRCIRDNRIYFSNARFSNIDKTKVSKNKQLHRWDVLVNSTGVGTLGRVAQIKKDTTLTTVDSHVTIVRPDLTKFDGRYFGYSMVAQQSYIESLGAGATGQTELSRERLSEITVPIYPLPTQRKIGAILSAYDDLIENNLRRIKILEEMAQNLYREWFVKFRFPGYEKVKFVDSPIGMIPEGWEIISLSDVTDTQYGYTESADVKNIGPKFLRGTDINKGSYIDWESVPHCPISEAQRSKYQLRVGDVVIIRMADPGKVGIVEQPIDAVFASYLIRVTPKDETIPNYFLYYILNSQEYYGYITGASTGTTRKSASAAVIVDYKVAMPSREILNDFESIVSKYRALLTNLVKSNGLLRRTRDLLLPKLVSGEVDVSDLDIKVQEEVSE